MHHSHRNRELQQAPSGFLRLIRSRADSADPPEPLPFPIKIVSDTPPTDDSTPPPSEVPTGKRNDSFYEAWDKFLALEPKRAKTISRAACKVEEEKQAVADGPTEGLQVKSENAARSWEQAAEECKVKVAAIVEECKRLNQKYRDAVFDLESNPYCLQSLNGRYPKAVESLDPPPWIKRVEDIFTDPEFFIDGASATDVHQGSSGDCWFLASLMAVSAKKQLIDNLCVARDPQVGVYGFVFYRDGEWIPEVVDDKLFLNVGDDDDLQVVRDWDKNKKEGLSLKIDADKLRNQLQTGGEALYFSHCKSSETWLPLIEKAYAKAHGDYYAIEGGFASEGIEDLTGGVGVVLNPEDIMDKEHFWREQLSKVNEKYLFGGGSKPIGSKGFVGGHAYAVLQAWEEGDLKLLKLRNPWGEVEWEGDWSDGSKLWTAEMMIKLNHTFGDDGVFWIGYKDFLKHFPSINRVRLFTKDWKVSQQWTCVSVPWTVDYLDTKFQFTITEHGPVIVVLSQPDDRYFFGLAGRYLFSMHFRVYKEGEADRWLVRSMHNSGNETVYTRSVSAELENLDPGTYSVVFKVTATRSPALSTAEEAILKYAIERKEKLLHVGRRYDYAHSKGNLKAMEEFVRKEKKLWAKTKQRAAFKKVRKLNQQEKARARLRKQRINEAMREKRKEFEVKRREKARRRRQRMEERRENESEDARADAGGFSKRGDHTPATEEAKHDTNDKLSEELATATQGDEKKSEEEPQSVSPQVEGRKHPGILSKGLSKLHLHSSRRESQQRSESLVFPLSEDDEECDSPLEPPSELDDNDFSWDSDMDGLVDSDTSSVSEEDVGSAAARSRHRSIANGAKKGIFGEDPWNALCVLGLRVYSLNSEARVAVVKGPDGS